MVMKYLVAIVAVSLITLGGVDDASGSDVLEYFKDAGKTERALRRQAAMQERRQRATEMIERGNIRRQRQREEYEAHKATRDEKLRAFKAEMAAKEAAEQRRFNSLTPQQQQKEREQELAREQEMDRAVDDFFNKMRMFGGGGDGGGDPRNKLDFRLQGTAEHNRGTPGW